jgi:hypothetical protein
MNIWKNHHIKQQVKCYPGKKLIFPLLLYAQQNTKLPVESTYELWK